MAAIAQVLAAAANSGLAWLPAVELVQDRVAVVNNGLGGGPVEIVQDREAAVSSGNRAAAIVHGTTAIVHGTMEIVPGPTEIDHDLVAFGATAPITPTAATTSSATAATPATSITISRALSARAIAMGVSTAGAVMEATIRVTTAVGTPAPGAIGPSTRRYGPAASGWERSAWPLPITSPTAIPTSPVSAASRSITIHSRYPPTSSRSLSRRW